MSFRLGMVIAIAVIFGIGLLFTFEHPPIEAVQRGYRGLGMAQEFQPKLRAAQSETNQLPEISPPQDPAGQPASAVYTNVQVLKDVDANEFLRLMADLTAWVAPQQGCGYCHAEGEDLSSDKLYTKVVARKMLQMTRTINANWKTHVDGVGVTCYTCHRGQPVPAYVWFETPPREHFNGMAQEWIAKNVPSRLVGNSSLPHDVFAPFFQKANDIRVLSTTALADDDRRSIKQAEVTYGLMMHISQSLGVNCTFCHNSRSFFDWDQSTPQRSSAWYGIRMVRELNNNYLGSLNDVFPVARLGPLGDVPKLNCATCHQGVSKPLLGASMLKEYPELAADVGSTTVPATPAPAPATSAPASGVAPPVNPQ
jgi:photosynthetic reaction center cytochrome c subunit